ncbi:MAG TPA: helix-turn-helix domain-containing protein [Thermodesulfobacteriota bacterium]|nr:helix-turn-helix domain-containing protein [Thermodesulfobacteriota bacterium]
MSTQLFANPRANPELKCLYEISQIPHQAEIQDYFLSVMAKMAEYFPIEYSALILYDSQKDFLMVEALYGVRKEDHPPGCNRRAGVISKVFETRHPVVIQNLGHEPLYQEIVKGIKRSEKIHPPMPCIPILADRLPIGVLTINSLYGPREELTEDLQVLSMLAAIISPVIKDFQIRKTYPLAKPDSPKLKFLLLEESLEGKLTEVLDKLAPYAEAKTHTGIFDDIISVIEKILIKSALEKVDYVQVAAAQLLGINRNTLHKKMKELKIKPR